MARLGLCLGALLLFGLPAIAAEPAPPEPVEVPPEVVALGTGSVAGGYFPVGVALCRLANEHRRETGLRCAARPSAGSGANVAGLRDGTYALAIVQSDTQADALAGTGAFAEAGPFEGLRSVMSLYPEPLTVVARGDAGIRGIEDLAGKRVVLGQPGSGTRTLADALVAALGWTSASFASTPDLPPERVGGALCDGQIDAFFYAVGQPAQVVQGATTGCDAVLVDAAGPVVDELVRSTPSFVAATIPAGTYRGMEDAVRTFGVTATLVSRADVPEDTVYAIVRSVFDDIDTLRGLDPVLARLDPAAMVKAGLTAPLHPGAERYYRERGWID
ncbi:MAG: TAXI family TRAP transporter solute-binding subunit [Amaricoccus sp.]